MVNYLSRTFSHTITATDTLRVIYRRYEVVYAYSTVLTGLFAYLTAYAADVAVGTGHRALVNRHTADPYVTVERNELYYVLRTACDANSAALTFMIVNESNSVLYLYSTERTL